MTKFNLKQFSHNLEQHLDREKSNLLEHRDFFNNLIDNDEAQYLWEITDKIHRTVDRISLILFMQRSLSDFGDTEFLTGSNVHVPLSTLLNKNINDGRIDNDFQDSLIRSIFFNTIENQD